MTTGHRPHIAVVHPRRTMTMMTGRRPLRLHGGTERQPQGFPNHQVSPFPWPLLSGRTRGSSGLRPSAQMCAGPFVYASMIVNVRDGRWPAAARVSPSNARPARETRHRPAMLAEDPPRRG